MAQKRVIENQQAMDEAIKKEQALVEAFSDGVDEMVKQLTVRDPSLEEMALEAALAIYDRLIAESKTRTERLERDYNSNRAEIESNKAKLEKQTRAVQELKQKLLAAEQESVRA